MTVGHYRAVVAYLAFWTPRHPNMGLDQAMQDIGITDSRQDVIKQMWRAGWDFDEETNRIKSRD